MAIAANTGEWKKTACILCTLNCGLEVLVDDRRILKVKGDKAHPGSEGYACQKPQRLDYYQNGKDRLTSPLRRRADGTYEEISWDTAITEIAEKLKSIRDTHGGHALAYFGGGGQGNHLNGAYGTCLRSALGTPYIYTSLAQEKTGGFWIDGKLFGKQNCHPTEDAANADFLLIIGSNPWQSHGFERARIVLRDIKKDPARSMIVIDPRRTETADLADDGRSVGVSLVGETLLISKPGDVTGRRGSIDHLLPRAKSLFGTLGVSPGVCDVGPLAQTPRFMRAFCRAGLASGQKRRATRGPPFQTLRQGVVSVYHSYRRPIRIR